MRRSQWPDRPALDNAEIVHAEYGNSDPMMTHRESFIPSPDCRTSAESGRAHTKAQIQTSNRATAAGYVGDSGNSRVPADADDTSDAAVRRRPSIAPGFGAAASGLHANRDWGELREWRRSDEHDVTNNHLRKRDALTAAVPRLIARAGTAQPVVTPGPSTAVVHDYISDLPDGHRRDQPSRNCFFRYRQPVGIRYDRR